MGWNEVSLEGVNPNRELITPGDYIFTVVPGAKIDDYNNLNFGVVVASDGDMKGRKTFISLPDPNKGPEYGWVVKSLKRLEIAVGIEQDHAAKETLVEWTNRLGANFSRFSAPLTHRTYKTKDGGDGVSENVNLGKARPAA